MKEMKRLNALLAALCLIAVLAVACGGPATTAAPEQPAATEAAAEQPSGEPVEITAWTFTYQPFVDGLNAMADDFNSKQSDVHVNVEVFEWANYWDKIAVAVATGTGPDVFHSYTQWTAKYIAEGVLQPLPEDQFPFDEMPPMVSQFRIAGKLWAVPMGLRTYAYIYNPDIFEAGGQTPPTTWDQEIPVAEALTKFDANGNMTVAGEGIYPKDEGFTQWQLRCHQAGGSYISEDLRTMTWDDPACVEAFTFQTSKMTEHQIFVDGFYDGWVTAQTEGAVAGFFQPSGALGALVGLETPWATAPMTQGPDNGDTLGNFWPLVMTQQAQGEKYDAALAFLKYAATPDAVRLWCDITYDVPSLTAVAHEDKYWNSQYSAFVQGLDSAVFIFDPASLEVRTGWEQAWDKVTLEGADPETALKEGMPNAQQILDDFWAKMDAQS